MLFIDEFSQHRAPPPGKFRSSGSSEAGAEAAIQALAMQQASPLPQQRPSQNAWHYNEVLPDDG